VLLHWVGGGDTGLSGDDQHEGMIVTAASVLHFIQQAGLELGTLIFVTTSSMIRAGHYPSRVLCRIHILCTFEHTAYSILNQAYPGLGPWGRVLYRPHIVHSLFATSDPLALGVW
jgi:hypothetical protein